MESGESERQKPIDCTIPVFMLEYSLENLLMKEVMERENRNRSMKVLIISDTHRSLNTLLEALEREEPIDMLIHLGDVERQMADIRQMVDCPIHMIAGNNDFLSGLSNEEVFKIGRYKVFITHGHGYMVNITEEHLQEAARELGADIVMYGHTHRPSLLIEEDLITLNPGSLTYPRQSGRHPSYIVMELDKAGEAQFEVRYL